MIARQIHVADFTSGAEAARGTVVVIDVFGNRRVDVEDIDGVGCGRLQARAVSLVGRLIEAGLLVEIEVDAIKLE